jgi:hypothetical protein
MLDSTNPVVAAVNADAPKRGKGRPAVYTGELADRVVSLIRSTDQGNGANVSRALEILTARDGKVGISKLEQADAVLRKAAGFDKPLKATKTKTGDGHKREHPISKPTLTKLAKLAAVKLLGKGRPRLPVAPVEQAVAA